MRETAADLQQAGVPFVMINSAQDVDGINYVGVDDVAIGGEAGEYLARRNRRHVALLASTSGSPTTAALRKGIASSLRKHGLSVHPDHVVHGALDPAKTLDAVDRLMQTDPRPDAIVCGSDLMAPELYSELRARGLKIPEDLAVISRGDLMFARLMEPALTTFRFPHFDIGYRSASILVDSVRDRDGACQRVLVPTPLVERASA